MSQQNERAKFGFLGLFIMVMVIIGAVYVTFTDFEAKPTPKPFIVESKEYTVIPSITLSSGETRLVMPWEYGHNREIINGKSNYKNIMDINKTDVIGRSLWINEGGTLFPAVSADSESITFDKFPARMTVSLEVVNDDIFIDVEKLKSNKDFVVWEMINDYNEELLLVTYYTKDYANLSIDIPVYFANGCLIESENPDDYFICTTLATTREVLGDDLTFLLNPFDKKSELLSEWEDTTTDKFSWEDSVNSRHSCLNGCDKYIKLTERLAIEDKLERYTKFIDLVDNITLEDKVDVQWTDGLITTDPMSWTDFVNATSE